MSFLKAFKFNIGRSFSTSNQIQNCFPMSLKFSYFVTNDLENIFKKILTDCVVRSEGVTDNIYEVLWDNCLASESSKGLVTLLAEAIVSKRELFLVYKAGVLRKATPTEQEKIRADYKRQASSSEGIYVSFAHYTLVDMLRIYSEMEYSVLNSLNKSMNLSAALQFKMSKMRESVGAFDSSQIEAQAKDIAEGLSEGKDVLLDGEDKIETSTPDIQSTKSAIMFLDSKRCFYLNLPLSYVNGEQTAGIGSTGEADSRAVERGLQSFFVSILKPVIKALFNVTITFKSNDFRLIDSGLEALKTFELTGEDYISLENKRLLTSKLFDVKNDVKGKPKQEQLVEQPIDNNLRTQENPAANSQQAQA